MNQKQARAKRPYFMLLESGGFAEKETEFDFYGGFAREQKQKNVRSMHASIKLKKPELNILEVSTKSAEPIGLKLSAFNLKYDNGGEYFSVENIYQSSKVFKNGERYNDLLFREPSRAKRDDRLRTSGELSAFEFNGEVWELEPKSAFYDYIYLKALADNKNLHNEILNYNAFTDIEFNPKKSINCQARSVAAFAVLIMSGNLYKALKDKESFLREYKNIDFSSAMPPNGLFG